MKKLLNLENMVYITIFSLPAYLIKIKFFGFSMNILEVFIIIILIGWILKGGYKQICIDPYKKYLVPIILVFSGLFISAIFNNNFISEAGIIKGWFFFPILFVFLAGQIIEKEKIINIFKSFYLSSFLVSAVALIFLFLEKTTYDGRLESFFNSPNYLAMYIAPSLIALAQIKNLKYNSAEKVFIFISGLNMLAAFYFTYSYAAWIAVILSLIALSVIKNKKLFRNRTTLILFLLVILLFVTQLESKKASNLKKYSRSSLESRIMIWRSAGNMLKKNWLLGVGSGNFQEKYLEYQKYYPPYLEWAVPHPHNLYMAFWLSGGVLSLAGFIWTVILWLREVIKKNDNAIKFIVLGIMFYILIHGIFDTTYFKNDLSIIFWLNFLALKS